MKRYNNKNLYIKKYPHHLPWHKSLWITKVGDYLKVDDIEYKVTNVELSAIRGSLPRITIEEVNKGD